MNVDQKWILSNIPSNLQDFSKQAVLNNYEIKEQIRENLKLKEKKSLKLILNFCQTLI